MNKLLLFFLVSILASISYASKFVIVEEVKDKKAQIYIPPGVEVKSGDQLFLNEQKEQISPPKNIQTGIMENHNSNNLRPRDHNLYLSYENGTSKFKYKDGLYSNQSIDSGSLSLRYERNYGILQPGIIIGSNLSRNGSSKTITTSIGVSLKCNFIPNIHGNNLIPFAGLTLSHYNSELETSGYTDAVVKGQTLGVVIGATWYPFSELFAFEMLLISEAGSLDYTTATSNGGVDISSNALLISSVLSF